ncbi:isoaspartyl peptidase/L-asparaginase family protein [Lutibacter sp.]|uniref:isoaspartyl peptidase/L-asparaginase family protein n=1 Tax=Lutibacter sp. TaxID=1925666 RepID=UPI002736F1E9|nr:N(4)-(beta-N-acetylglucosaminyl)-L-asparaginase [Lutibacter sp.]MDP3311932.1 N(4)-(beta-N-acetylglucosaminyl)-L-asparaginase [Lutibacter sp.]
MKTRRNFLKLSALGGVAIISNSCFSKENESVKINDTSKNVIKPIVISTWIHGMEANAAAWEILAKKGNSIDAVEAGVRVTESDPENSSVGIGGLPDRDGKVTLDACIMDHENNCGAVACLQDIENPISVARKVMEDTPHVMLVGDGAKQFALEKGFKETNLLTNSSKTAWEKWKEESKYQPVINSENHDTIGLLALDEKGNLAGACTTSGMAYKLHGRVGDSPIIGAGLFVDNEVGAACATGVGEAVIRIAGSAIVVELMRNGLSPNDACKEAVQRIIKKHKDLTNMQVGFIALNKYGETGGYSVYAGFNYALKSSSQNEMVDAKFDRNW